jgi:hypothetical protein
MFNALASPSRCARSQESRIKNRMVDFDGISYPATLPTRWRSSIKKEAGER